MSNDLDMQKISINVGQGHDGTGVAGTILIGTVPPAEVGAGCTVYSFSNGQMTHMDILYEEASLTDPNVSTINRVRAHTDLSPLDHVCIETIRVHFEGNPPNEVYCKLLKLNPRDIQKMSIIDKSGSAETTVAPPTLTPIEGKPNE